MSNSTNVIDFGQKVNERRAAAQIADLAAKRQAKINETVGQALDAFFDGDLLKAAVKTVEVRKLKRATEEQPTC